MGFSRGLRDALDPSAACPRGTQRIASRREKRAFVFGATRVDANAECLSKGGNMTKFTFVNLDDLRGCYDSASLAMMWTPLALTGWLDG